MTAATLNSEDLMAPLFGSTVHTQPNRIDGEISALVRMRNTKKGTNGRLQWLRIDVKPRSSVAQMLKRAPWVIGLPTHTSVAAASKEKKVDL